MRVFIGIKASNELQQKIAGWQEKYKDLPVRFVNPQNLHLTLVPPWYENNINKIIKKLGKFSLQKIFEVSFTQLSLGPPYRPRLIWLSGPSQKELLRMQNELAKLLSVRSQRYSNPHITIARFKEQDAGLIPAINESVGLRLEVSKITLFESRLSKEGASYFPLKSISYT